MFHRIVFVLICLIGTLTPVKTSAQTTTNTCGVDDDYPAACRQFSRTGSLATGVPLLFQFHVVALPSFAAAAVYYEGAVSGSQKSDSLNLKPVHTELSFGFNYTTLEGSTVIGGSELTTGVVIFTDGLASTSVVALWAVAGVGIAPFDLLHEIWFTKSSQYSSRASASEQVLSFLPTVDDLPPGFAITAEQRSAALKTEATDSSKNTSKDPSDGSDSPNGLKATIAALQTQVASNEQRTSRTEPAPTSAPSSSPLELVDITTKDAGLGGGTFYAYVEIRNRSSRSYPYLGVDATCRDSSGSVVGTGFGNTTNVGPGETVVITVIFFSSPGCTRIEVRPDSLTGML